MDNFKNTFVRCAPYIGGSLLGAGVVAYIWKRSQPTKTERCVYLVVCLVVTTFCLRLQLYIRNCKVEYVGQKCVYRLHLPT